MGTGYLREHIGQMRRSMGGPTEAGHQGARRGALESASGNGAWEWGSCGNRSGECVDESFVVKYSCICILYFVFINIGWEDRGRPPGVLQGRIGKGKREGTWGRGTCGSASGECVDESYVVQYVCICILYFAFVFCILYVSTKV